MMTSDSNPLSGLRAALARADVPSIVHLDVTYRCDLDCEHCYLDQKDTWPEMVTADWLTLLAELYEAGVPYLIWSGGEVFARPDFMELLSFASARGFSSVVKTHAGNIGPELAAQLAGLGVTRVDVSVYSLDEEIHDGITRVPGSLAATLAGIRALCDAGVEVRAATVAMNANVDELPGLEAFFTSLGCSFSGSLHVLPDHSASDQLDSLNLSEEAYVRGKRATLTKASRDSGVKPKFIPDGTPCGAGRTLAYVAPDGALWPCVMFPMHIGQVRERPFLASWHDSEKRAELRKWTNAERTDCQSCAGNGHCFYCAGEAYKRTGDYRKAPDVFHQRTKLAMIAYEPHGDVTYTEEEWRSVPETTLAPAEKKKFVFPIYQPERGQRKTGSTTGG